MTKALVSFEVVSLALQNLPCHARSEATPTANQISVKVN